MRLETNQRKAYLCGLAAVALWSTVATAFKLSLRFLRPEALLFYASLTSALVLAVIVIIQGKFRIERSLFRSLRLSLILGALNPFLYYLVLFRAYDLLRAQEAQALNYTWAITMSILAVPLLGQRLGGLQILATVLSYCGAVVIATQGHLTLTVSSPLGVALALGSTVIWSLFWIFGMRDPLDAVLRLFFNFCCGSVYIGVFCLLAGHSLVPNTSGILGAVYIGFFEMGLTFVLWSQALRLSATAAQVSSLIYLSPFVSLGIIHVVLGESILTSTLVGLGFILAGTGVQRVADGHRRE